MTKMDLASTARSRCGTAICGRCGRGHQLLVICSEMAEAPAAWQVDGVPYAQLGAAAAEATIRRMRPKHLVTHHHFAWPPSRCPRAWVPGRCCCSTTTISSRPWLIAPDLCVYNTEWVRKSLALRYRRLSQARALVIHPPVIPEEHRAPKLGRHVTLVNLNRDKGVDTWRGAAALLGSMPFLGVTGAHGKQVTRPVLGA